MIGDKKNYNILVIEDNPGDFDIVEELLLEEIHQPSIINAPNFKKAEQLLTQGAKAFDIILLDLTLPDKSGQQLITEMMRIAHTSPIIILTGLGDIDLSIKYIAQGISDYLLKDYLTAPTLYKSIAYSIERKRIFSELEESKKRYSNLFHLSPQPMWLYDMETLRFLQVNKAATEHYGYTEEDFLRMTIMDIRPTEDITFVLDALSKLETKKDAINKGTYRHQKNNGEIIEVEVYSTPITIDERACRSVIAIDITEKNLYEQNMIKAIIKAQDDERYEIGGELHDNVGQILATSLISLGMLKKSVTEQGALWFDESKANISLAIKEIRDLSHRIAPKFFDDTTLEEAIKKLFYLFNIEGKYQTELYFDTEVNKYPISLEIQLHLYRILQEQLKNILKHAEATTIKVFVTVGDNKLKVKITDDGIGFDVALVKTGIGLANIKRRIALFSGKLEIESSIGNGCTTLIELPIVY